MQVGDKIAFGKYSWLVLDCDDGKALIITQDIIELRAYHNKPDNIVWADCEMRQYLNGEFLDSFSQEDKQRILQTTISNCDNPWFGTSGGDNTVDRVFLLSIQEVACKYFGNSSQNLRIPNGKYKYWFARKDINNINRTSTYLGYSWWWWLRSPGRKQVKAAYVHGDGNIGMQGNSALKCNLTSVYHPVTNEVKGGVRPAMWIKT